MTVEISNDLWDMFKENDLEDIDNNSEASSEDSESDLCIHCKSEDLQLDNGHIICKTCGTINNTSIDCNANGDIMVMMTVNFQIQQDVDYLQILCYHNQSGSTISFKHNESYDMRKIRNYHMWNAMPYKERALHNVFESIQIRAINSGIPSCIIEEAKILYKKISEKKISRGNNRRGIIASCIYKACSIQGSQEVVKKLPIFLRFQLKV